MMKKKTLDTGLTHVAWLVFVIHVTQGPGKAKRKNWVTMQFDMMFIE